MNKISTIAMSHTDCTTRDYARTVLFNIVLNCEKYQMLILIEKYNLIRVFSVGLNLPELETVQNSIAAINRIHTILDTEGTYI